MYEIDAHHCQLVELVNHQIDLNACSVSRREVLSALQIMTDYLGTDFTGEKSYMILWGYPEFEEHLYEHKVYVNQAEAFVAAFKNLQEHLPDDILLIPQKGLDDYILYANQRICYYLATNRSDKYLRTIVRHHRDDPAQEIIDAVVDSVHQHIGNAKPTDDITLVVIKVI